MKGIWSLEESLGFWRPGWGEVGFSCSLAHVMISSPDGISEGSELIWGVTDHRRRRVLTGFLSMTDAFLSLRGEGGRRGRGRATIQPDRSTDRPIKIPIINIMTTLTRFYVIRHRRYVAKSMVLKTGSVSSPSKRLVVFLLF